MAIGPLLARLLGAYALGRWLQRRLRAPAAHSTLHLTQRWAAPSRSRGRSGRHRAAARRPSDLPRRRSSIGR